MISAILSEYVGTFIFLLVILVVGHPIPVALSLLAVIYAIGNISGGHVNPAISTMMFVKGDITLQTYIAYVIAQVLGALSALVCYMYFVEDKKK